MTSRYRKQPADFRKEEVNYVMNRWRSSDSCALVGVGSVGKSNLLQHLADPDVCNTHLGATGEQFRAIIIDPNLLGPLPSGTPDADQVRCWAAYELMMHRLFMAFYPFDVLGRDDAQRFYEAYQALQDGTNPIYAYMGLRYFELGLEFFMRRGVRIVFMFDEFEDFLRSMPARFFQTLRGLRDANKSQLSYLTFTRAPIPSLAEQFNLPRDEMEPFVELFTDNVYYVGPYNKTDTTRMIETLEKRQRRTFNKDALDFLVWATGAYAGLLRSGYRVLEGVSDFGTNRPANEELLRQFALRRPIRTECDTLWNSLTEPERLVLRFVAKNTQPTIDPETETAIAVLVQKRLIHVDPERSTLTIQPPVFRMFVQQQSDSGAGAD